jgi:hypothetical protein
MALEATHPSAQIRESKLGAAKYAAEVALAGTAA